MRIKSSAVIILALLPCLASCGHTADFSSLNWDIAAKDSVATEDFTVYEYGLFTVLLEFRVTKESGITAANSPLPTFLGRDQPGTIIPVHLTIEKLDAQITPVLIMDQTFDTNRVTGWTGPLDFFRDIAKVKLKPGTYRVIASTTKDTIIPPNVEVFLELGGRTWKERPLRDNK